MQFFFNQPITWQQHYAENHADTVKTLSWIIHIKYQNDFNNGLKVNIRPEALDQGLFGLLFVHT